MDREQLGNNPFNPDRKASVYAVVQIEQQGEAEVRYRETILLGWRALSVKGNDMLLYISEQLDKDKDYLYIDKVKYMAKAGVRSRITAKSILDELVVESFITPTNKRGWYWINPYKIIKL